MQLGIDIIEEDRGLNNFTPSHPIKMQRNILIHKLNQQQEKNWRWWKEIHLSDIRMFKSMPKHAPTKFSVKCLNDIWEWFCKLGIVGLFYMYRDNMKDLKWVPECNSRPRNRSFWFQYKKA